MTVVYGVTYIGAQDQIKKQLKNTYPYDDYQELKTATKITTNEVFRAIGDIFSNAEKIKTFFKDCCKLITKTNQPVRWITPLGFPVVQPYFDDFFFSELEESLFFRDINFNFQESH